MNSYSNLSLKAFVAGLALLVSPLGISQIPEADLDSIFERLNGDDYDARYDARMDLQDAVSLAGAPGSEDQPSLVEAQLLERLASESLLTTRLWILRQLQLIGTEASITPLESLLSSDSRELVDAVKMTLRSISGMRLEQQPMELSDKVSELLNALDDTDNESVQSAIFEKIALKSPKQAELVLQKSPSPEYIRIAMTSNKRRLVKAAREWLQSDDVALQIVVLAALDGKISSRIEKQLIALLESENETLVSQTLDALGRVGSYRSSEAILALSDARSKDIRDAAIDALAAMKDSRIDRNLLTAARKGGSKERAKAVKAMSYRVSEGVTELINTFAADENLEVELREEAIAAMELVGNERSLSVLVDIVLKEETSGLRRDAQKVLKRMTLRAGDPQAAWRAFKAGFDRADKDGKLALMLVADSAPTEGMLTYLQEAYESGDPAYQKMVIRVLPSWRSWDGGHTLLAIAQKADSDAKVRTQCFKGIGRIILGVDGNDVVEAKFDLGGAAFAAAETDAEKEAVLSGFRYFSGFDKRYLNQNEDKVAPEIVEAINNAQRK